MGRNVTVAAGMLDQNTRTAIDKLMDGPLPTILRHALQAVRHLDDGLTSAPQHRLYGILEALYGWRSEAMPVLQEPVRAVYDAALRRTGTQNVQTSAIREMLGLASYIADGGKAGRIGERIGALCEALCELRQGPLLRDEIASVEREAA